MQFSFNHNTYTIPTSLAEITLGQRIDFDAWHKKNMAAQEKKIASMQEGIEKETEQFMYQIELLCNSFSFFTGIDIAEIKEHIDLGQLCNLFLPCFRALFETQEDISLQSTYLWKDEIWELASPHVDYKSAMTFNEFLTAKQVIKSLHDLGEGNWTALQYLCAIFLRKKGEAFEESFATEDGERFKDMRELPMDIALSVAFFLSSSSRAWLNNFPSLVMQEPAVA